MEDLPSGCVLGFQARDEDVEMVGVPFNQILTRFSPFYPEVSDLLTRRRAE